MWEHVGDQPSVPASVPASAPTVATKHQLGEDQRKTPPKRIRAALCWLNIFN